MNSVRRAAWLALTVSFAFFVRQIVSANVEEMPVHLVVATTLYIGISAIIIKLYLRQNGACQSILAQDDLLSIPRAFFKNHCLHFEEINSVEKYCNSDVVLAVLIGRLKKSSILVARKNFAHEHEFDDFVRILLQLSSNQAVKPSKDIVAVAARREVTNQHLFALLTSTLLITYVLFASPNIEKTNALAIAQGGIIKGALKFSEIYRIASAFFLHITPFHLGFNVLALTIFGRHIEVIMGRTRTINILFLSTISGALLSLLLSPAEIVIGASGGVLGLFGAYLNVCLRFQGQLPGSVSMSGRAILLVFVVQVISDAMISGIDSFSHIGGFVFGFLYASKVLHRQTAAQADQSSLAEFVLAVGVALSFIFGLIYFFALHFGMNGK